MMIKKSIDSAMKILTTEKQIIVVRRLSEEPKTLEELQKYKISRERIRQIETKIEKLQSQ